MSIEWCRERQKRAAKELRKKNPPDWARLALFDAFTEEIVNPDHKLTVMRASRSCIHLDRFIREKHYLHKWPAVTPYVFRLCIDDLAGINRSVGVICFSFPPKQAERRYGCSVLELSRLWVADEMPKNTESWFISRAIGMIRKSDRSIGGIVSYADPSVGHEGVIYRACGFLYDGMTDGERKTPRCDYKCNGVRYSRRAHVPAGCEFERVPRVSKHRYFFPLHRCVRRAFQEANNAR